VLPWAGERGTAREVCAQKRWSPLYDLHLSMDTLVFLSSWLAAARDPKRQHSPRYDRGVSGGIEDSVFRQDQVIHGHLGQRQYDDVTWGTVRHAYESELFGCAAPALCPFCKGSCR